METPNINEISSRDRIWLIALTEVAGSLREAGIKHFLDTGTLLGGVRGGAFIPWDNDIDIGVVDCQYDNPRLIKFINQMCAKGYLANRSITSIGLFSNSGVEINIKIYSQESDYLVGDYSYHTCDSHALTFLYNVSSGRHISSHGHRLSYFIKSALIALRPTWGNILLPWLSRRVTQHILISKVPVKAVLPLGTIIFYGIEFSAPSDCISYLVARYGINWNIVVKDYDYTRDDLSISGHHS